MFRSPKQYSTDPPDRCCRKGELASTFKFSFVAKLLNVAPAKCSLLRWPSQHMLAEYQGHLPLLFRFLTFTSSAVEMFSSLLAKASLTFSNFLSVSQTVLFFLLSWRTIKTPEKLGKCVRFKSPRRCAFKQIIQLALRPILLIALVSFTA